MFRIGEFSKLTQVSVRMLRHYDETGLLKPSKTDKFTGYRLYAANQIPVLNKIIFLRDLGFNISEIAQALDKWENEYIHALLDNKRKDIENTIKAEQSKIAKIEQAKTDMVKEEAAVNYNVAIKSVPSYQVFSLRRVMPDYYAEGILWKEMTQFAQKHNIPISDNTFTIYHDMEYKEKDVDIEICAPVESIGEDSDGFIYRLTEAVPVMASTMVYGPFENIAGVYFSLAGWLSEHSQYKMSGKSRQIVHRGPWNEKLPEKYLTEIQIPLLSALNPK